LLLQHLKQHTSVRSFHLLSFTHGEVNILSVYSNYGDVRAISQSRSQAERIKLLSLVEVLEPLSTEEIGWLAQRTIERSFQGGETVYVPGDASEVVYLLLAGRIRLYGMAGGQELTFDIIQAGTMFGVASLMERTQDEYALALEPSRVGLLDLNDFWHLVGQNPKIIARVVKLLGDRLRLSRSRMADIALKKVPARLASLILDLVQSEGVVTREGHYKIPARYTHQQLAHMIGAQRVAVTRAFGKLQDAGCVRLWRRQIYVVDLTALRRLDVAR
jgi:CRP/FNR family transcriptional regulator, cyclic AMP receptor protein